MTLPRRILQWLGRAAPVFGIAILLAFGVLVVTGTVQQVRFPPVAAAWISALLVLAWFLTRLPWRTHFAQRPRARDEQEELSFEMDHGRGPTGWRNRGRTRARPWHGRSPDGRRPQFD
jgi:hypothetical protein